MIILLRRARNWQEYPRATIGRSGQATLDINGRNI